MSAQMNDQVRQDCRKTLNSGRENLLSPLRDKTLLITGGTGFVGTWIAETVACLNDDFSFNTRLHLLARSTDRFTMTYPHLAGRKDIALIKSDVRHFFEIPEETNWVIHAAGNPDNRFHSSSPVETISVIADGTASIIRTIDRCSNLEKFLNISSGLVYGPQPLTLERISETYVGPSAPGIVSASYAEAKRFAETLCAAARSQEKLPVVTARPFAFLGPYQSLDTPWAINNFIHDAMTSNIIRVLGDGKTVRSYMYGSDMAFWFLRILTAGAPGRSYNVGSPDEITLVEVASIVADRFSPRPDIRLRSSSTAHTTRFVPDISLAADTLGLGLTVPLKEAIDLTVQWNRNVVHTPIEIE